MASPYHNVFYYFRGPSKQTAADQPVLSTQIEDNTTKALVNVLELAGPGVAASWLGTLGIRIEETLPPTSPIYFLQGGPANSSAPNRHLVVITAGSQYDDALWAEEMPGGSKGRVDAAIHAPEDCLVVIESKIAAVLDGVQLKRHASDWGIAVPERQGPGAPPEEWRFTTWAEVHKWARDELARADSPVARFLLKQFAEYLVIIGVAGFWGFLEQDFELLAARRRWTQTPVSPGGTQDWAEATDPIQAAAIKRRVDGMWEEILAGLTPVERTALGKIRVGTLKVQDRIWAMTNAGQRLANLTLELDPERLELDVVAWNTDRALRFQKWIATVQGQQVLADLPNFKLAVWRRRAHKAKSGKPFWRQETASLVAEIALDDVAGLPARLATYRAEPKWEHLAYHLRREWSREEVLSLGPEILAEATTAVRHAIPVMHAINNVPQLHESEAFS